ncbi:MAG: 16S rRNA (uracil(1498)-N(3))-methyltransferase [Crocosphaera sp.]|nr:16S rRNA (uracil(1498)-N(3))-methyltransferase [Crocosphaera sp.]
MAYRIVIEPGQKQGNIINLNPEQKHYLTNVLRLKQDSQFIVLDGQNNTYIVKLNNDNGEIIEELNEQTELPITITLMIALPKSKGFDEVIRSCTELGVNTIIPIISQRTVLKPSSHKLERWRRISQEATEQSERQIVPVIREPVSFSKALTNIKQTDQNCYICVARKQAKHLLTYLLEETTNSITIATGCEGGWTDEEINKAVAFGFIPVNLGSRILRAVTAPLVCLSLIASVIEKSHLGE